MEKITLEEIQKTKSGGFLTFEQSKIIFNLEDEKKALECECGSDKFERYSMLVRCSECKRYKILFII